VSSVHYQRQPIFSVASFLLSLTLAANLNISSPAMANSNAQDNHEGEAPSVPPSTDEKQSEDKDQNTDKDNPRRNHKISFEGAPDDLIPKFKILAETDNKKNYFPTRTALRRAAQKDASSFRGALHAAGYYAATVDFRIKDISPETDLTDIKDQSNNPKRNSKYELIFEVKPERAFQATEHKITYNDNFTDNRPVSFEAFDLKTSSAADGASLQANQQNFLTKLWDNGYPRAKIIGRRAEANFSDTSAVIIYEFISGPRAMFGDAIIKGIDRTKDDYIRKLTTWDPGALYEKSKTLTYRERLSATNLFSNINVVPGTTQDDGTTPILVDLAERKHRTIGAGLGFSTSEGPGVRVYFENRNLFKRAERFRIDLEVSQINQSTAFILEKPLLSLPGSVFLQGQFANATTDAFNARTVDLAAGVAKQWFEGKLETRGGLALETSQITPANGDPEERTFFASLPLSATWNNEDDILNPVKGVRASLVVTPYTGTATFTQFDARARTRFGFGQQKKLITAFQTRIAGTLGSSFETLPVNKRFFSGGGGSVRGYGFQLVGPVTPEFDDEGQVIDLIPIGGRSLIEAATELRYSVTQNIQVATFLDTGSVSDTALPDFSNPFFLGTGIGVRYLTPVGPLRVDLAIPLNQREGDNSFQFLISLGQAF